MENALRFNCIIIAGWSDLTVVVAVNVFKSEIDCMTAWLVEGVTWVGELSLNSTET